MSLHLNSGGVPGPSTITGSQPFSAQMHPSPGPRWPSAWAGRSVLSLIGRSVRTLSDLASFMRTSGLGKEFPDHLDDTTDRRLDETNWPSRPLRIGLIDSGPWAKGLLHATGIWSTEWFIVPDGNFRASVCRDHVLDAVVRPLAGNGLQLDICENPGLDAAWFDWSQCCPLSYPAVFPARVDPARITLIDGRADDPTLLRSLLETAALLSRHPARLTREDRIKGRRPYLGSCEETGTFDAAARAMHSLANFLPFTSTSAAPRAASRVLSAFLATSPNWIDEQSRIATMDACARISADEPQTMLRLAAVRLGMGQDDAGLDAIERADRMLRDQQLVSSTTQEGFIRSELEHGHPGPLTIGRLAAGICMLVSTMPASQVPYFRDDLLDDMRFCSLLIGRDQDRKLLMQVFRALERVRRAESFGLPLGDPAQPQTESTPAQPADAVATSPRAKAAKPKKLVVKRNNTRSRKRAA